MNLPIRTLVLYSISRVQSSGVRVDLLNREIRNLVGRAGRAGATTKGLRICANEAQWPAVAAVADQVPGERVDGALRHLVDAIQEQIVTRHLAIDNTLLERSPVVASLIDGIDATLIELAATEIGVEELRRLAVELADETFAAQRMEAASRELLRDVFTLRAERVSALRTGGRLAWVRETGAWVRMVAPVEEQLLSMRDSWSEFTEPLDPELTTPVLDWAFERPEVVLAIREALRLDPDENIEGVKLLASLRLHFG